MQNINRISCILNIRKPSGDHPMKGKATGTVVLGRETIDTSRSCSVPDFIDSSLVALLETLDIAIHDTTNDKKMGLNYNMVDAVLYTKVGLDLCVHLETSLILSFSRGSRC